MKDKRDQNLIEYIFTIALVAISIIVAVTFLGNRLSGMFTNTRAGSQQRSPAAR